MKQQFKYEIINRCYPLAMTNDYKEGKKVNIVQKVGNGGMVLITDGYSEQVCMRCQLKEIEE